MSDQAKTIEVRGKALYMEFRHSTTRNTFQLLVHPDGTAGSGEYVPFGVFFRTLNQSYPKRPWSTAAVSLVTVPARPVNETTGRLVTADTAAGAVATAEKFQKHVADIFDQLTRQGFGLFMQPVVVELSNVDLDEIAAAATPYALFRRVMSARKALGFPDDLLVPSTPTL